MMSPAEAKSRNLLFLWLAGCFLLWMGSHDVQSRWPGVPPVPGERGLLLMTLNDPQFSYRIGAITLQSLGDDGGRVTPLKDYDYNKLLVWFRLLRKLDPVSDHVSMIAAYYFGATRDKAQARQVAEFLEEAGKSGKGEKWRWLVQAVFLARYRAEDLDYALKLAYELSNLKLENGEELPIWARQMPAFVLTAMGEKDAAKGLLLSILATDKGLSPNEINFTLGFLKERLGVDVEGGTAKSAMPE